MRARTGYITSFIIMLVFSGIVFSSLMKAVKRSSFCDSIYLEMSVKYLTVVNCSIKENCSSSKELGNSITLQNEIHVKKLRRYRMEWLWVEFFRKLFKWGIWIFLKLLDYLKILFLFFFSQVLPQKLGQFCFSSINVYFLNNKLFLEVFLLLQSFLIP